MKKVIFALIVTVLVFQCVYGQANVGSSQKFLFRDSEKQIKELYNELMGKLNDTGKQMLRDDQKEWLHKRKIIVSKQAQQSEEYANILIIKANQARVQTLEQLLQKMNSNKGNGDPDYNSNSKTTEIAKNDPNLNSSKKIYSEAEQLLNQKKFSEATFKYKETYDEVNKLTGNYNNHKILILSKIGLSLELDSKWNESLSYKIQALDFARKTYKWNDISLADCMQNLGIAYGITGQYQNAISLLQQALSIKQQLLGESNIQVATILNGIASNYYMLGDCVDALSISQKSLSIVKGLPGDHSGDLIQIMILLGNIYKSLSDYNTALDTYQKAILLNEKQNPPNEQTEAWLLEGISGIYDVTLQYKLKVDILNRVLSIKEKVFGVDSPFLSTTLQGLGNAYGKIGDIKKGIYYLEKSLAMLEHNNQELGLLGIYNDLGLIYQTSGDYSKALAYHTKALEISERLYGPSHPTTATTLSDIATAYCGAGDIVSARASTLKWINSVDNTLNNILSLGEKQRLNWAVNNLNFSLPVSNLKPEKLAEVVLRWKGIVVDSICEDRTIMSRLSTTDQGRATLQEIAKLKTRIGDLSVDPSGKSEAKIQEIQKQIDSIESSITQIAMLGGRARSSSNISVDQIAAKLAKNELVIDFITYFDPKTKTYLYGAIIIDSNGDSKWVSTGECLPINNTIFEFRQGLNIEDEDRMKRQLSYIYDHLWQPIEDALPKNTAKVFIAPDGVLNLMSFAVLLDKDRRFLSENLSIAYLGSGRDLLRSFEKNYSNKIIVFADPEFNEQINNSKYIEANDITLREISSIQIPQLPGTRKEAEYICQQANSNGWSSEVHLGREASKSQLFAIKAPSILHMATHGFYLNPVGFSGDQSRGMKIKETTDANADKNDNLGGIGVLFDIIDPHKKIIEVVSGSPAEKSGIKINDEIISVNNHKTIDVPVARLAEMVRGEPGSQINLEIKRLDSTDTIKLSIARERLTEKGPIAYVDPMRASGLALAGAQTTLDHWANKKTTSTDNNGIVTAEDITALNLNSTWLVTLSSCDSGVGQVQYGEGVFGLRRAFMMAGTQNLLTALWPVSDSFTATFMGDFYKQAFSTHDVPEALAAVQREWLLKLRQDKGFLTAVRQAGPFVLSTTGSIR